MKSMTNDLFDSAFELLENYDFAGARAAYYKAVLVAEPSPEHLSNLYTAETGEKRLLLKRLCELYPASQHIRIAEANYAKDHGNKTYAISVFTRLLNDKSFSVKEQARIRLFRFGVSCEQLPPDIGLLIEDFRFLWSCVECDVEINSLRTIIVKAVLRELQDSRCISFFEQLLATEKLGKEVRHLFQSKIDQLHLLESFLAS